MGRGERGLMMVAVWRGLAPAKIQGGVAERDRYNKQSNFHSPKCPPDMHILIGEVLGVFP